MKKPLYSLSTKLLVSIIIWLIGAVSFTGLTLNLSWELENGGVAINDAGSLRKRMYHMAALASQVGQQQDIFREQTDFETVVDRLERINTQSWLNPENGEIHQRLQDIRLTSRQIIEQFLKAANTGDLSLALLHRTQDFITQIDALVKAIEIQNTKNIRLLRLFQFILIGMVIFSAFVAIFFLGRLVIRPLDILKTGIQKISHGDLAARVIPISHDEFGEVSDGFNQMAANLSDLYDNLELKVKEKTLALEEKNHELQLLYEITAFLHESQTQENMAKGFLKYIMDICQAKAGSIRILEKGKKQLDYISSIGLPESLVNSETAAPSEKILGGISAHQSNIIIQHIDPNDPQFRDAGLLPFDHSVIFYIRHNLKDIGILTLYFEHDHHLTEQDIRLIETLTNQLGVSIENQRWALLEKQLGIVEERNLMAQGLHDSIAQSLSFLNMQVQMLENALREHNREQALENLKFIQEGVQESYDDVRELLLNFRTRINQEDFPQAVQSVINRFQKQVNIPVDLHISDSESQLNIEQQLQAVFILQEALSNVRKHAQAQHVRVDICNNDDFVMTIDDDGVGFDSQTLLSKKDRHVGMGIMHERAARANGNVSISSPHARKGTRVMLTIPISGAKRSTP